MKRIIALLVVAMAMTGCGNPSADDVQNVTITDTTTETTTEEIAGVPSPDTTDVRVYCVSLDAARNLILNEYKDKIPEKLIDTFDANSSVLDSYIEKAGKELSPEEAKKMFGEMQKLEIFFCETMAKELGAGDKIQQVAMNATQISAYDLFKNIGNNDETEVSEETETTTDISKKEKK